MIDDLLAPDSLARTSIGAASLIAALTMRSFGVPSSLGDVPDMRTAMIGAVADSGASNVKSQQGANAYGPNVRTRWGTW